MRMVKSKRQSTDVCQKYTTFRISQVIQPHSNRNSSTRLPFHDKRNHPIHLNSSKSILRVATKKTFNSSRNLRQPSSVMQALSRLAKMNSSLSADLIMKEVDFARRRKLVKQCNQGETLSGIFVISQRMHEEVYSYKQIETDLKELHNLVKKLGSSILTYRSYAFAGFVLFEYGSYSLSLYYFDKALKSFYDRDTTSLQVFENKIEIEVYKCVCRIFLVKGRYQEAKNFGYKLLRKSWVIECIDSQMAAFDLLGKIYMQMQSITMCRYFHWRMRSCEKESGKILSMSRQELERSLGTRVDMQFVCYETINIFVEKDEHFNDILENNYRVRSMEYSKTDKIDGQTKTKFAYTHHSPNRQLKNYHILQRKMIEAKDSRELHFIRPKDSNRIKKILSDYSALIHEMMQKSSVNQYASTFSIRQEEGSQECKESRVA